MLPKMLDQVEGKYAFLCTDPIPLNLLAPKLDSATSQQHPLNLYET